MSHEESAAEILVLSAKDEAVLLKCSTKVKVQKRGLAHPMGSVCFQYKFYFLYEPRYKLGIGNSSSFKTFSWGNCLTFGAP